MRSTVLTALAIFAVTVTGCVSAHLHKDTLAELEDARQAAATRAAEFGKLKEASASELEALKHENSQLANQLLAAQAAEMKAQRQFEMVNDSLAYEQDSHREMQAHVAQLQSQVDQMDRMKEEIERERNSLRTKMDDQQAQVSDLSSKLEVEQTKVATLVQDKERLKDEAGMTRGELDRAQQRTAGLKTSLAERDEEIGQLRQASADREALMGQVAALTQERDRLSMELDRQHGRLVADAAEKARLERERAEKEAEIERLTRTQEELSESLQAEIARGDIRIQQVRDQLRINMVDRVLFNSGQGHVKPAGLKVLKQMSEVLRTIDDKQIRIEGHTDNVPIGPKLVKRFPTNWELSTARATSVVRYFTEKGGVATDTISAVGYADTRPVADNDSEEGRTANRRIEIVLYPKDLSDIASQLNP